MNNTIRDILDKETDRQENTIELIASENFASQAVKDLCGSVFTNKYAEGYPGRRYYNGCAYMDEIEDYAKELVCLLYGCDYANVQPHSGANANTAVYQALLKPGDKVVAMDLSSGGHLSHGASVNQSAKLYNFYHYGVDETGHIDYHQVADIVREVKPKMIIAGASAYPRVIHWDAFREIADRHNAIFMVDMAHYSGLIAGGAYPSPFPYADVVTSTTHKTLRGPRGGMILWNDPSLTKAINSAVFPGTQGGPLMNIIAAKAQCYSEALEKPSFDLYASSVVAHARAMANEFEKLGVSIFTHGTDSHIVLLDLRGHSLSGKDVADGLEKRGITVNKNGVPNDPRPFTQTSGIRIGTAAETTRVGIFSEYYFRELARDIVLAMDDMFENGS